MKRKSGCEPLHRGFGLVELLVGMTFMTVGLLAIAAMFPAGYLLVSDSGTTTMSVTAARQLLEDVRSVPFADLALLNGVDTTNVATLPATEPARQLVRKWRYALAGEGSGFTFTTAERSRWARLSIATAGLAGRGRITVTSPSGSLRLVTVTISAPRTRDMSISTLVTRM
jgi:Tfp pilus assembly protein PilV